MHPRSLRHQTWKTIITTDCCVSSNHLEQAARPAHPLRGLFQRFQNLSASPHLSFPHTSLCFRFRRESEGAPPISRQEPRSCPFRRRFKRGPTRYISVCGELVDFGRRGRHCGTCQCFLPRLTFNSPTSDDQHLLPLLPLPPLSEPSLVTSSSPAFSLSTDRNRAVRISEKGATACPRAGINHKHNGRPPSHHQETQLLPSSTTLPNLSW